MFNLNNLNITNNLNFSFITQFNLVFKIFFLLADIFAVVFLIVVIKQIFSMDNIVHDSNDSLFIKTFGFLLLLVTVSLFLISLVIL
jgi:hypothetical protein